MSELEHSLNNLNNVEAAPALPSENRSNEEIVPNIVNNDNMYNTIIKNLVSKINSFEMKECQPSLWDNICMRAYKLTTFWSRKRDVHIDKDAFSIDILQIFYLSRSLKRLVLEHDCIGIIDLVHLKKDSIRYTDINVITKINNSPYLKIRHGTSDLEFLTSDTQISASIADAIKLISLKLHSKTIVVTIKRSA